MEQVVANIYAACLSAEAEPHAELVDLTINAIQDGMAGPNKDETLGAIFTAVQELTLERQQKGALFRIKLTAIAAAAKALPQSTRDALLKSLRAMEEVARQQVLSATSSTITFLVDAISKVETAVGQPVADSGERSQSGAKHEKKPGAAQPMGLVEFLKSKGINFAGSDKVFIAPNIPMKKINGAMQSIARWASPNEIAVLVDDTVFGGAKEGVFFTDEWMVVKELMNDPSPYQLKNIETIGVEGRKLYVNSIETLTLNMPEKSELSILFSAVNEYIQTLNSAPQSSGRGSDGSARAESHESADIRVGTDFFDGLVREMRSSVARDEVDDVEHYELIIETVVLSGTLHRFCTAHCPSLSSEARWAAQCDPIRFAIFTYLCTLIQWLLVTKCNFNEDDMATFMARFLGAVVAAYSGAMEAEHYEYRTLRRVANPELYIKESLLFNEWRGNAQGYLGIMERNPGELPEAFHQNLEDVSESLWLWDQEQKLLSHRVGGLCAEFLSPDVSFAYMRGISQDMEDAMMRFFERVNF